MGHRRRAEDPLGRVDPDRRHHYQAAGCCGVLAQDGSGLPQEPLVLGIRFAEASSYFCWRSAGRSLGGRGTFLAFQASLEHFLMHAGASVRVPRRCGGIFGTAEFVQETLPCPTYMDDLAILLEADSYPALLASLATVRRWRRILAFSSIWHLARRKQW